MTNTNRKGLEVVGTTRVFNKTKEITSKGKTFSITDYWFTVGKKDENGEWENKSMNLFFRKDDDKPDHNEDITIYKSFPILHGEGKYQRIGVMVMEWDYPSEEEPEPQPKRKRKSK